MSLFLPHQFSAVEDELRPVIALSLSGNHRGPEPLHLEPYVFTRGNDSTKSSSHSAAGRKAPPSRMQHQQSSAQAGRRKTHALGSAPLRAAVILQIMPQWSRHWREPLRKPRSIGFPALRLQQCIFRFPCALDCRSLRTGIVEDSHR